MDVVPVIPTLDVLIVSDVLVVMASVVGLGLVVVDMDVMGLVKLELVVVALEVVGLDMLELDAV